MKKNQPKYVENDFYNKPRKQPKCTRVRTIFQASEEVVTHCSDNFVPEWKSSDYFHFACEKCSSVADVLKVEFFPYPIDSEGKKKNYAIFFSLGCANCGETGERVFFCKPNPESLV